MKKFLPPVILLSAFICAHAGNFIPDMSRLTTFEDAEQISGGGGVLKRPFLRVFKGGSKLFIYFERAHNEEKTLELVV